MKPIESRNFIPVISYKSLEITMVRHKSSATVSTRTYYERANPPICWGLFSLEAISRSFAKTTEYKKNLLGFFYEEHNIT